MIYCNQHVCLFCLELRLKQLQLDFGTLCVSADGRVHVFGGNQFGQLGLGTNPDQCEVTCFCIICHLGSELGYCWFFLIEVDQKLLLSTLCCEVTYFKDDKQVS